MKKSVLLASMLALATGCAATSPSTDETEVRQQGKLKIETIQTKGSQGMIEEERVQAMRSEIRFVPNGSSDGYLLTGSEGTTLNAHKDGGTLTPSWNLFSW